MDYNDPTNYFQMTYCVCPYCKSEDVHEVRDNTDRISAILPLEFVSDDDLLEGSPFTDLIGHHLETYVVCHFCGKFGLKEDWEQEAIDHKNDY